MISIDVKTAPENPIPTADYININVDATVNVKISSDVNKIGIAAQNFFK